MVHSAIALTVALRSSSTASSLLTGLVAGDGERGSSIAAVVEASTSSIASSVSAARGSVLVSLRSGANQSLPKSSLHTSK